MASRQAVGSARGLPACRLLRMPALVGLAVSGLLAVGCSSERSRAQVRLGDVSARITAADREPTVDRQTLALLRIARELAAADDRDGGRETARRAVARLGATPPEDSPDLLAARSIDAAQILLELEDLAGAAEALEEAVTRSGAIANTKQKARLLATIGVLYGSTDARHGLGDPGNARRVLARAEQTVGELPDGDRAEAMTQVVRGFIRAGQPREAGDLVDQLERLIGTIPEPRVRLDALLGCGLVRMRAGDQTRARTLMLRAAETARTLEAGEQRVNALVAVAEGMAATGELVTASGILVESDQAAARIPGPEALRARILRLQESYAARQARADIRPPTLIQE